MLMKRNMTMNNKKRLKPLLNLNFTVSFILIFLFSMGLTLMMLWLQPDGIMDIIECTRRTKGLNILLNFIPVLIFSLLLFFISSNLVISFSITAFVMLLMGFVNRQKILLRNDPFLPWDISLGFEVMGIAKSFGLKMILAVIFGILLYILFSAAVFILVKNKKLDVKIRLGGVFICILSAFFLNGSLYKNQKINSSLAVIGNVYNQVNTFNSKGFLYSFIYANNTNRISKPDGYNPDLVIEKMNSFEKSGIEELKSAEKPHIFMIMGEAFSEISLNPNFDFTGYTDPLENFKKIKEDSIYGQIVVPNLGGGTADTEFDSLTGLSSRHLRGAPFAYRLVGNDFEAMPSVLSEIGYKSEALHPGYSWFYNRENVFKFFGFEKSVFLDDFNPETQNKGMYINEEVTIDKVIEMYEESINENPDTPYFGFCVTIQNHGPYNDKYQANTNFSSSIPLSDSDINALSNYFEGLKDADIELMRLINYINESKEPIVLLYYGDHLPAFSQEVYKAFYPEEYEVNSKEDLTRLYRTPFIIYQNKAAKEISAIEENAKTLFMPEDRTISSNYVGAYLIDLLGYKNISPFFDYVNSLRELYPLIFEHTSFTAYGDSTANISPEDKKDLLLYRDWEFYKIFSK
ncbi:MAG: LTA synthase family protein [Lachnospiraceae bacterium]|nr:LTA synthase family protein [Lachnospiraceae bacterium]